MLFLRHVTAFLLILAITGVCAQGIDDTKTYQKDQQNVSTLNLVYEIQGSKLDNDHSGILFSNQLEEELLALVVENMVSSDGDDNTIAVEFLSPTMDAKYKRGRMIEIRWTGGNADDEYSLDLYSGRHHYLQIGELKNSGVYPWIIPSDVEPGKEYKLKLTNTEDFGEFAFSKTFIIKRKTPVALWLVPAAALVIGGVVYLFVHEDPIELSDLPAPIEPQ